MSGRVRFLAYGYLRLTDERDDEEIRQLELGLRKLAEAEGLWLTEMCYEYQPGYYGTFYELLEELKRVRVGLCQSGSVMCFYRRRITCRRIRCCGSSYAGSWSTQGCGCGWWSHCADLDR